MEKLMQYIQQNEDRPSDHLAVFALAAIITIFPVCYVIFGSFKDNKELLVGGSSILPSKWVFDNYVQAWKQANFATYTMNSVFLSLAVMLISLINASMAGYVFARKNFKGKELLYMLFVAFMFINVGSVSFVLYLSLLLS